MGNFLSLFWVENIKLWKRISTKIMPLILIAVVFGLLGLVKLESNVVSTARMQQSGASVQAVPGGWKAALELQDKALQQQIDAAQKSTHQLDKNSLDSDKRQLAENQYDLAHNQRPATLSEDGSYNTKATIPFWKNVMSSGMWQFVALLAIIACSALVAGEFGEGTMKTMLPRPFARWQILTAKLLVIVVYTLFLSVLAYLCTLAAIAAYFGTGGIGDSALLWLHGSIVAMPGFAASLLGEALDFCTALVYVLLGFALSAVSRSRALATGLSIFLMFSGSLFGLVATHFIWGKLIFFVDTNFSGFLVSGAPFYGITLPLALLICGAYALLFLAGSYLAFDKRDVAG